MLNLAAREGLRNVRRDPALTVVLAGATALVLLLSAFVGAHIALSSFSTSTALQC